MPTLSTIGYEGIDLTEFLGVLKKHRIATVLDVRELPLSRKKGFSKRALANALKADGIGYLHHRNLGCPKSIRDRYKADGDWVRYSRAFREYLDGQDEALQGGADLAHAGGCVLLCFEADPNRCHRSIVAQEISDRCGADVIDLRAGRLTAKSSAAPRLAFASGIE